MSGTLIMFDLNGVEYKASKLSAKKQFHVIRRLAPVMGAVAKNFSEAEQSDAEKLTSKDLDLMTGFADVVTSMPDEQVDYILDTCMATVSRKAEKTGSWQPIMVGDASAFEDIDMAAMLQITYQVLRGNLSGFFANLPSDLNDKLSEMVSNG